MATWGIIAALLALVILFSSSHAGTANTVDFGQAIGKNHAGTLTSKAREPREYEPGIPFRYAGKGF